MKERPKSAIVAALMSLVLTGCGLLTSHDKSRIQIELDARHLTEHNSVTASINNGSSDAALIFWNTLHSSLQRKNVSGKWIRLFAHTVNMGEPIAYSDWSTHLEPHFRFDTVVDHDLIEYLIRVNAHHYESEDSFTTKGKYRFVFELVFNEDYQNKKRLYSQSFTVAASTAL